MKCGESDMRLLEVIIKGTFEDRKRRKVRKT